MLRRSHSILRSDLIAEMSTNQDADDTGPVAHDYRKDVKLSDVPKEAEELFTNYAHIPKDDIVRHVCKIVSIPLLGCLPPSTKSCLAR